MWGMKYKLGEDVLNQKVVDRRGFIPAQVRYRTIAFLLDIIAIYILWAILGIGMQHFFPKLNFIVVLTFVSLFTLTPLGYFIGLQSAMNGQTIGKRLMKIRVMAIDDNNVLVPIRGRYGVLLKRTISYFADFALVRGMGTFGILGFIYMFRTPYKQRKGDFLARTIVVEAQPRSVQRGKEDLLFHKWVIGASRKNRTAERQAFGPCPTCGCRIDYEEAFCINCGPLD